MNDLGSFSRCALESASGSGTQAKWLRGKSLAISLAIEATLLSALLLLPLYATGVLPPVFVVTPTRPYIAPTVEHSSHRVPDLVTRNRIPAQNPPLRRPVIRSTAEQVQGPPPMIGTSVANQLPAAGPGIPGGEDRGAIVSLSPPQTAPHNKPLAQSEGVMAARLVLRVQPEYPRLAKLMHLSGDVRLRAIIGTDGSVQQLEVLSGNPILSRAAVLAVRRWRYQPTRLNGQPVEVQTNITVTFVLN